MPHKAFGTTFTWNSVVAATLTSINGIEITASEIDDTNHQSPDSFTQSSPGLRTAGDIALAGFFSNADTTGQHAMLTDAAAGTKRASIITFPTATGATWTMASSWIKALKIGDADLDGNIPFTATVKPDGKPVFAVATAAGMSALTISNSAVVSPTFAIGTFDYVATVLTAVASVTFTPTSAAGTITITANGVSQTVATTQASSAIALGGAGSITTVVVVISETNKASKTYTVRVVRGV